MSTTQYLSLGAQGRVVIPALLRKQLGLRAGDQLVAKAEHGRLILSRASDDWVALKKNVKAAAGSRSLASELIEQRRQEAKLDHADT